MKLDLVITTYNRPLRIESLIDQVLSCSRPPDSIIVVDSSDVYNSSLSENLKIKYVYSTHKNQPYQRYLGYLLSRSEILVYLDDDMELLNVDAFSKIKGLFQTMEICAVGLNFENRNAFLNESLPKSFTRSSQSSFFRFIRTITANPDLKEGRYWWCGVKGRQPELSGFTEWFSGGAFAVRREALYKNFNFTLFSLYEEGIGKGEDGILSFTISRIGKIFFLQEKLFFHNDPGNSVYSQNFYKFAKRVSYSRFYLASEYGRLLDYPRIYSYVVYSWYVFFRIIGLFLNIVLKPGKERLDLLKGYFHGWALVIFKKRRKNQQELDFWRKEAIKDIERSN